MKFLEKKKIQMKKIIMTLKKKKNMKKKQIKKFILINSFVLKIAKIYMYFFKIQNII